MTTEVYINGLAIDVDNGVTVAASYAGTNFGTLGKRSGAKTNTWTAPFTTRNKLVFEGAEVVGSWSTVPYRKATIKVDIDGVTAFEGWSILDQSADGYEIVSFAGASDFYSVISNSDLRDIDLSEYDHVWSEVSVRNSLTRTDGYIYAFAEFGKEWPFSRVPVDSLRPSVFFKDVVLAIVDYAGYSISGAVLTEPRFLVHMVIPTESPYPFVLGDTVSLSRVLPDLVQSKVWLDFANIYGLQFEVNDQTKEIIATYVDDLLFNEAEDWTSKVDSSEDHTTSYRFGTYGQKTYLKYKPFTVTNESAGSNYSKEITVDDEYLRDTADLYVSEFTLIQNESTPTVWTTRTFLSKGKPFSGVWSSATAYVYNGGDGAIAWYQGTYYKNIQTGTNKVPPTEPTYWEVIAEAEIWTVAARPTYGVLTADPAFYINVAYSSGDELILKKLTNVGMKWTDIYPEKYRVLARVLQKTKILEKLIKLNYADINQLDFTRPKLIDGEIYMVQEIKQFKLNESDSTIVNLVRI